MSRELARRLAALEAQQQGAEDNPDAFWKDTFGSGKPGWDVSGFPGRTLDEKIVAAACAVRWTEESPVPAHLWEAAREWLADQEGLDELV